MPTIAKIVNRILALMRSGRRPLSGEDATGQGGASENAAQLMQRAFPLHQSGDVAAAEALYRRILTIKPGDPDAQFLLGCIAQGRGEPDEAIRRVCAAIQSKDQEPAFHRALALLYVSLDRWQEAAGCWRRALELNPGDPQDWIRLGRTLRELGEMEEARRSFDRAIQIDPASVPSLVGTALVCRDMAQIEESIALFRRARALAPEDLELLSAYLFTLNLSTKMTREEIFQEHLECDRLLGVIRGTRRKPLARDLKQGDRLRIGYLSPDFNYHVASFFIEPFLLYHDRSRFDVHCYYLRDRHDGATDRLRKLSDHWADCAKLSDADIAQRIEIDRIDILVDLAGHTDWNRIAVLAHRPAPVIATWLGYLNTTGLRSVNYRITDRYTDPPGATERFHTETLIRLPASQWCRLKPAQSIPASPLRPTRTGPVRFGSFNKSSKLTPDALRLWSRVLLRVPRSTLLFADVEDHRRDAIRDVFRACGVAVERLDFAGRLTHDQFFMLHHRADIALDAYPYSGATTTLDTLWMGVPVLTLAGDAPISRSTASILTTLGMHDWIARSTDEFVEIAARLSGDLEALDSLRPAIRGRLENSILMDGERFTRQLEEIYRQMWCEQGKSDSLIKGSP